MEVDAATGDLLIALPHRPHPQALRPPGAPVDRAGAGGWQDLAAGPRACRGALHCRFSGQVGFAVGAYDRSAPLTIDQRLCLARILAAVARDTISVQQSRSMPMITSILLAGLIGRLSDYVGCVRQHHQW